MKTKLLMAAIIAGLAASAVQANDGMSRRGGGMGPMGGAPMMDFATLDQNGDGAITLEELQSIPQSRFAAADSNVDGALSSDELSAQMAAQMAARVAQMMSRFDANGDGLLQADEMPKPRGEMPVERMLAHLDTDDDGQISQEEFAAAAEMHGKGRGGMHGGRGEGHGKGHGEGHGHGDGHSHGHGDDDHDS